LMAGIAAVDVSKQFSEPPWHWVGGEDPSASDSVDQ
jgi:hypothetical protein